jgi:hypothetical protein
MKVTKSDVIKFKAELSRINPTVMDVSEIIDVLDELIIYGALTLKDDGPIRTDSPLYRVVQSLSQGLPVIALDWNGEKLCLDCAIRDDEYATLTSEDISNQVTFYWPDTKEDLIGEECEKCLHKWQWLTK